MYNIYAHTRKSVIIITSEILVVGSMPVEKYGRSEFDRRRDYKCCI